MTDLIYGFLTNNWQIAAIVVLLSSYALEPILKTAKQFALSIRDSTSKFNNKAGKHGAGFTCPFDSVGDDVEKDIVSFVWLQDRARAAGDSQLLKDIEDVNKKFYSAVYSSIYASRNDS